MGRRCGVPLDADLLGGYRQLGCRWQRCLPEMRSPEDRWRCTPPVPGGAQDEGVSQPKGESGADPACAGEAGGSDAAGRSWPRRRASKWWVVELGTIGTNTPCALRARLTGTALSKNDGLPGAAAPPVPQSHFVTNATWAEANPPRSGRQVSTAGSLDVTTSVTSAFLGIAPTWRPPSGGNDGRWVDCRASRQGWQPGGLRRERQATKIPPLSVRRDGFVVPRHPRLRSAAAPK